MTVLVTGGAGYVGSHTLLALAAAGERALCLDDLSTGSRDLAPDTVPLIVGDIGDRERVETLIGEFGIKEVIHFGGSSHVRESLERPLAYYRNNTANTLALLEACVRTGVERFIFSSTGAVYGEPEYSPLSETSPLDPITPYGASMEMSERIVRDAGAAHGFSWMILRYFNAAGADRKLRAGEIGKPSHILKIAAQIAVGARREKLEVYGADYPTPDGTAIRDYIHVVDVADAHLAALRSLRRNGEPAILNIGYGRGYSVYEVLRAVERVSGSAIPCEIGPRRRGDPPYLIADSAAARRILDWSPRFDDINLIVRSALDWERKLLNAS